MPGHRQRLAKPLRSLCRKHGILPGRDGLAVAVHHVTKPCDQPRHHQQHESNAQRVTYADEIHRPVAARPITHTNRLLAAFASLRGVLNTEKSCGSCQRRRTAEECAGIHDSGSFARRHPSFKCRSSAFPLLWLCGQVRRAAPAGDRPSPSSPVGQPRDWYCQNTCARRRADPPARSFRCG